MSKYWAILAVALAITTTYIFNYHLMFPVELPKNVDHDFGSFNGGDADRTIHNVKIRIDDKVLNDLREKLNETIFFESFKDTSHQYGINDKYLRRINDYWLNNYDWRKWEKVINGVQHFTTRIYNLNVHFVRSKPKIVNVDKKIMPILLIHGWPGSIFEFYKIMPMLNEMHYNSLTFDVVAPSIPGYGWSEKPSKSGFAPVSAAQLFGTLMIERLKFEKFYCHGGDWGSLICTYMAEMFPNSVVGIHLTMAHTPINFPGFWTHLFVGYFVPSLIFNSNEDYNKIFPLLPKLNDMLQESGYLHIQASKPDTVGFALLNHPMALAGYIAEKFISWTDMKYRNDKNIAEIERKISLDEMLTNIMIYWTTGTILSSQRFYKEHFLHPHTRLYDRALVSIPTGVASFPNEPLRCSPINFLAYKYRNITRYSDMESGGHFPALEQSKALVVEIVEFVMSTIVDPQVS